MAGSHPHPACWATEPCLEVLSGSLSCVAPADQEVRKQRRALSSCSAPGPSALSCSPLHQVCRGFSCPHFMAKDTGVQRGGQHFAQSCHHCSRGHTLHVTATSTVNTSTVSGYPEPCVATLCSSPDPCQVASPCSGHPQAHSDEEEELGNPPLGALDTPMNKQHPPPFV